jgi:tRNA A37 N6-isopentenylltransferase MiaA
MSPQSLANAIIICGPTTTGKTEVASRLARELRGALINTDHYQLYASGDFRLGVGLSKDEPPADVPCYLFGALSINQAGPSPEKLVDLQVAAACEAASKGYVPIFVGCSFRLNRMLIERQLTKHVFTLIWEDESSLLGRCSRRAGRMIDEGLLQETQDILAKGLNTHWVVSRNVVYKAVISWIENGSRNRQSLIEEISRGIIAVALEQERKYGQLSDVEWLPVSSAADATDKILHEIITE